MNKVAALNAANKIIDIVKRRYLQRDKDLEVFESYFASQCNNVLVYEFQQINENLWDLKLMEGDITHSGLVAYSPIVGWSGTPEDWVIPLLTRALQEKT